VGQAMMRECSCGCHHHLDDAKFIGAQECGNGEVALLRNCPNCKTSYAASVLTDAALCCSCGHAIVGDVEDPKIVVSFVDEESGYRIFCVDCNPERGFLRRRAPRT
jgi:hypothetical protein